MIHQLKAILPILGFPGSCATYGRFSYATAHNTANDSPHRAGVSCEFSPSTRVATVAVVVAIWCNTKRCFARLFESVWNGGTPRFCLEDSGSSAAANRCEPPCLEVLLLTGCPSLPRSSPTMCPCTCSALLCSALLCSCDLEDA
jgi:hypothetical protein